MHSSSLIRVLCLVAGHVATAAAVSSIDNNKRQDTTTYVSMMDGYGPDNCNGLPDAPLNLLQGQAGECIPYGSSYGAVKLKYLQEGCTVTLYDNEGCKGGGAAPIELDECKASTTADVTYAYYKTTCA